MSEYKSEFLKTLSERGYLKQVTHPAEVDAYCAKGIPTGYIGFDATADSLHVGSLLQIMMLRHLQKSGGKPIVLMGGGTTKVGDPTDKEKSRPLLTNEQIAANMEGIKKAFQPFLTFGDGPTDAIMVNNDDWLGKLGYLEMLREVGVHFTINTMVKQDTVARRLAAEQPYTFLEFNYLLMQSYDFLELFRRHECRMQIGGSDQWGNIVGGVDLVHKAASGDAFGITAHLITTASGGKMGKTAAGAVWLNEAQLPNYDFWQYWRNVDDRDVGRFLRLFTDLPLDEIARLEALGGSDINEAKTVLANQVTTLVRGEEAARLAAQTAAETFAGGGAGADLPTLDVGPDGMRIGAVLTALGFTASNGEAKRKLAEGAVKLDGETVTDPGYLVSVAADAEAKLSLGKKKHAVIRC